MIGTIDNFVSGYFKMIITRNRIPRPKKAGLEFCESICLSGIL